MVKIIEVEVEAIFLSWSLFSILPLMFFRGFEIESGRDSEARFGQDFEF